MKACLGIGSNIGDRIEYLRESLRMIENYAIVIQSVSPVYETPPVGVTDQAIFLNAAVIIETECTPVKLLRVCQDIENKLGRIRNERWGPRVIDIDILLCDSIVMESVNLTIPHPLMHTRAFVLKPLADIAGDYVHPVIGSSVYELLTRVDIGGISQIPDQL